ncbi:DNA helicase RecQ [Endomicrobium proavitum]|uniref:DNA helicase RecQ n=1 Tax=Endomicrobium proavitum TaxID=1408281 RepID=A0A0G3WII3_9BACT|nr:DNA helicase RecQ [Endomicrobium proavitum]AKL98446.1 putative ATP-dependent DNA helicase RecQ [Endomicrobium proavitum]
MTTNFAEQKLQVLKEYFGHQSFRSVQEELIDATLAGRDALGIMPTGAGKSVCFQVPAVLFDGITIVISPLISLMKDQTASLTQNGIKSAYINSSLTPAQTKKILDNALAGEYKLIYIAPERLDYDGFLNFTRKIKISMVTIDEAHCVSQWGQDFRPSYTKIAGFVSGINPRPIVSAFTATATPRVRKDIVDILELNAPQISVASFDRANLKFDVRHPVKKFNELIEILKDKKDKSGIIYCLTRKTVDDLTEKLKAAGFNAASYHAGLTTKQRHANQDDFIFDRVNIIVATNAFGMGIDKSNVSFVIHYNMPKDIESYYQEAGRAGRDGSPADCIVLYSGQDIMTNLFLINNSDGREYETPEDELYLKSLERERLKEMDQYCNTNECLRHYILKYFGEIPSWNECANCGNCNAESKMEDITILSQKILSCVVRMQGNFGKNFVMDVLRGSKAEKIISFGFNKLSTYGICAESKEKLKDVINFLTINKFLATTNTEFPVLKLGARAAEILKDKIKVEMKVSTAQKVEAADIVSKYKDKPDKNIVINKELFEALKRLRQTIAAQQNVPAYIIFPNTALIDMCGKLPKTKEEFSQISGVGSQKLEKYGDIFVKTIIEFLNGR